MNLEKLNSKIIEEQNPQNLIDLLLPNLKWNFLNKANLNEWKNVLNKFQDIFKEQGLSNSIQKNLEKKHQLNSTLIFTILKFIKTLLSNTNKNLSSFNLEQDILNFIYLGDEYLLLSLDIIRVFYSQVNFTDSFNYKKLKNQNSKKSWDLIVFESLFHFANPILFNSKSIPFTFLDSFHNEFNQNLKQKKYGKISFGFFVSDQNENQEELLQKMEIDFNEWKGSPVDHLQKLYSQNQEIDKFSEIILTNYFLFQNFQKDPNLFSQIRLKALRTLFSILPRNNIFVEQIKKNEPNLIQQLNDLILTEEKIDYKLRFLALDLLKEIFLNSSFETLIFSKIDFITPKETQSKKQTISEMIQSLCLSFNESLKDDEYDINVKILQKLMKFLKKISASQNGKFIYQEKNSWIFSPSTLITENINQKTLKLNKIIINTWYYLSIRNDQFASFLKDQNLPEKLIKIIESHLKLNDQKKQLNLMLFSNRQMMSYINCCFSLLSLFTSKFGNELKEKISKSFVFGLIENVFKNQELCEKSHNLYIRVSAFFYEILHYTSILSINHQRKLLNHFIQTTKQILPSIEENQINIIFMIISFFSKKEKTAKIISSQQFIESFLRALIIPQFANTMKNSLANEIGQLLDNIINLIPNVHDNVMEMIITLLQEISKFQNEKQNEKQNEDLEKSKYQNFQSSIDIMSQFLLKFLSYKDNLSSFIKKKGVEALLNVFTSENLSEDLSVENLANNFGRLLLQFIEKFAREVFHPMFMVVDEYFKGFEKLSSSLQYLQTACVYMKILSHLIHFKPENKQQQTIVILISKELQYYHQIGLDEKLWILLNELEWGNIENSFKNKLSNNIENIPNDNDEKDEKTKTSKKESLLNQYKKSLANYIEEFFIGVSHITILSLFIEKDGDKKTASLPSEQALEISSTTANLMISQFNFLISKQKQSKEFKLEHLLFIISLLKRSDKMLFLKIPKITQSEILDTLLLTNLYYKGFIKSLINLFKDIVSIPKESLSSLTQSEKMQSNQEDTKSQSQNAINTYDQCLESFIQLFIPITSFKSILLSPISSSINGFKFPFISNPLNIENFSYTLQKDIIYKITEQIWIQDFKGLFSQERYPTQFLKQIILTVGFVLHESNEKITEKIKKIADENIKKKTIEIRKEKKKVRSVNQNLVNILVDMGFQRNHAERALREVGGDSLEAATEWMISNPIQEDSESQNEKIIKEESLGEKENKQEDEKQTQEFRQNFVDNIENDLFSKLFNLLKKRKFGEIENEVASIFKYQSQKQEDPQILCSMIISEFQEKLQKAYNMKVESNVILDENNQIREQRLNVLIKTFILFLYSPEIFELEYVQALGLNDEDKFHQELIIMSRESGIVEILFQVIEDFVEDCEKMKESKEKIWKPYITSGLLALEMLVPSSEDRKKENDFDKKKDFYKKMIVVGVKLLQIIPSELEAFQALLQFISKLISEFGLASKFVDLNGLKYLIEMNIDQYNFPLNKINPLYYTILREVIEDPETIQYCMENEIISSFFYQFEPEFTADFTLLVRNYSRMICKNFDIFMKSLLNVCKFQSLDLNTNQKVCLVDEKQIKERFKKEIPKENHKWIISKLMDSLSERIKLQNLNLNTKFNDFNSNNKEPSINFVLDTLIHLVKSFPDQFSEVILKSIVKIEKDDTVVEIEFPELVLKFLILVSPERSFELFTLICSNRNVNGEILRKAFNLISDDLNEYVNKIEKDSSIFLCKHVHMLIDMIFVLSKMFGFPGILDFSTMERFFETILFKVFYEERRQEIVNNLINILNKIDITNPELIFLIISNLRFLEVYSRVLYVPQNRLLKLQDDLNTNKIQVVSISKEEISDLINRINEIKTRFVEFLKVKQGNEQDQNIYNTYLVPLQKEGVIDFDDITDSQTTKVDEINSKKRVIKQLKPLHHPIFEEYEDFLIIFFTSNTNEENKKNNDNADKQQASQHQSLGNLDKIHHLQIFGRNLFNKFEPKNRSQKKKKKYEKNEGLSFLEQYSLLLQSKIQKELLEKTKKEEEEKEKQKQKEIEIENKKEDKKEEEEIEEVFEELDPSILEVLPEDLRLEVIENHERKRAKFIQKQKSKKKQENTTEPTQPKSEVDNGAFVESLPFDLRKEVYLTCDEAFLKSLPPNLRAEADNIRNKVLNEIKILQSFMHGKQPKIGVNRLQYNDISDSLKETVGLNRSKIIQFMEIVNQEVNKEVPVIDEFGISQIVKLSSLYGSDLFETTIERFLIETIYNLCQHQDLKIKVVNVLLSIIGCSKPREINKILNMEIEEDIKQENVTMSKLSDFTKKIGYFIFESEFESEQNENISRNEKESFALTTETILTEATIPFGVLNHVFDTVIRLINLDSVCDYLVYPQEKQEKNNENIQIENVSPNNQFTFFAELLHIFSRIAFGSKSDALVSKNFTIMEKLAKYIENEKEEQKAEIPFVSEEYIKTFVDFILNNSFGESFLERGISLLEFLILNPKNCEKTLSVLISVSKKLGDEVFRSLKSFHRDLTKTIQNGMKKFPELSKYDKMKNPKFIRVIKTFVRSIRQYRREYAKNFAKKIPDSTEKPLNPNYLRSQLKFENLQKTFGNCLVKVFQFKNQQEGEQKENETDSQNKKDLSQEFEEPTIPITKETTVNFLKILSPIIQVFCLLFLPEKGDSFNNSKFRNENEKENENEDEKEKEKEKDDEKEKGKKTRLRRLESIVSTLSSDYSMKNDQESISFISMITQHRKIINNIIAENPNLLSQELSVLKLVPNLIDFDNKRKYFYEALHANQENNYGSVSLTIRRSKILEDSYNQLRHQSVQKLHGGLRIKFTGEEAADAGGVRRDWFSNLTKAMFNPGYALFAPTNKKDSTYQPNRFSYINPVHLDYFNFVGKIIGKAIYDGIFLDAYFTRSFYKHMLGIPVTYHDMEAIDNEYYKSLKWMLENDITGILDLVFSADFEEFGNTVAVDLIPNGRNIPVTEQNKRAYVKLVCELKMTKSIESQIKSFLQGFHALIPRDLISIFDENELELLISGLPTIDISDLRANVNYSGYTESSSQIKWFWEIVESFDQEQRAKLLLFVTGTSKVPLDGFSALQGMNGLQKFQIHRTGDLRRLPSAHTCFNQLDLPEYKTQDAMRQKLVYAINETKGFGFI